MADDHAPKTVHAEMNECLQLGNDEEGANDRKWVMWAAALL